jgi:hypothetical protein
MGGPEKALSLIQLKLSHTDKMNAFGASNSVTLLVSIFCMG